MHSLLAEQHRMQELNEKGIRLQSTDAYWQEKVASREDAEAKNRKHIFTRFQSALFLWHHFMKDGMKKVLRILNDHPAAIITEKIFANRNSIIN